MTNLTRKLVVAGLLLMTVSDVALSQRGGRGGGGRGGGRGGGMRGGGMRGGGGGFRGGGGRPSMSRGSIARPNVSRPNVSNLARPSNPIARPGVGNINRGNINRGNINRGNINTGNINRNVNWDNDYGCCNGRGVAWAAGAVTGAAVANNYGYGGYGYGYPAYSTAAVVTLPAGCSTTVVNGVTYQQCGSTWYQEQFVGDNVSYVTVSPP